MQILPKLPLNERAYECIKERIITLELGPGTQINERSLENSLSIGRTPIREALFRLAAEELVEQNHGRGFFVKPITIDDVKALFEAMLIFEKDCAELSARRVQKDHIKRLHQINIELKEAMRVQDFFQVTLLNSSLHRVIYEATDNRFLCSSLNHLQNQAQRLAYLSYSREMAPDDLKANFKKVTESHETIITFLEEKDRERLVWAITKHAKLFHLRVLNYLSPSIGSLENLFKTGESYQVEL